MNTKALRSKILDLAIHGKLLSEKEAVECRKGETATELLEKIRKEKEEKIAKGELKADKKSSYIFVGDDNAHYEKFADGTAKCVEDEIPFGVPEGWAWCRGKEIFLPMASCKPKGDIFKYIDIDSIDNKNCKLKQPKIVETKDTPSRASRHTEIGDVLFSMVRPYLKNIALITEGECIASTGFFVCKPCKILNSKFLYYLMISDYVVNGINQFMKGDNSPSVNGEDILSWFYPLPPLSEQKAIVAKIEEIFAQIDILENNKTDLQTAIKHAKTKILDLAIHGKLVPQDPNDEPASKLLEKIHSDSKNATDNRRYQNIDNEPFEIPVNWCWCKLGVIVNIISGTSYNKQDMSDKGIRILRGGNLSDDNKIKLYNNDVFLEVDYISDIKQVLKKDIIIVASTGSEKIIGKPVFAEKDYPMTQIGAFLRIIRVKEKKYADYINIIFQSSFYRNHIKQISKGTNIKNIKEEYISDFAIPLPPLAEQKRIVAKIESLFSMLDKITENLL